MLWHLVNKTLGINSVLDVVSSISVCLIKAFCSLLLLPYLWNDETAQKCNFTNSLCLISYRFAKSLLGET